MAKKDIDWSLLKTKEDEIQSFNLEQLETTLNVAIDWREIDEFEERVKKAYENIEMTIINEKKSQRKFYHDSPFEIMLAFDEEEEIVSLLKGMAKTFREE